VIDRLKLADLHQINPLKIACGKMIRKKFCKLGKTDKWTELKETSPQLAFSAIEGPCTGVHSDDTTSGSGSSSDSSDSDSS
jgi:hypothetical protein